MTRLFPIVFLIVGIIPTTAISVQQSRKVANQPGELVELENELAEPLDANTKRLNELAEEFPDSVLQKRFQSDESTRLLFQHFGKPLKITAFEKGKFEIRLTRQFSADDIDGLADNHPELLKYAEAFPRTTDDSTTVKLTIETEVTFTAANEQQFAVQHPKLCEIYREFKDAPIHNEFLTDPAERSARSSATAVLR